MPTQKLTAEIIHAAIEGFESQKRRIDSQIDELRQLLNGGSAEPGAESGSPARKRKISAAGRRRMAAAQKARWAKIRGEAEPTSSSSRTQTGKAETKLSAAGRKAISEATKRRWAVKRAEAQSKPTVAKKAASKKSASKKSGRPEDFGSDCDRHRPISCLANCAIANPDLPGLGFGVGTEHFVPSSQRIVAFWFGDCAFDVSKILQ